MSEYLHWKDPRAIELPGYAWAAAEIERCAALGQGIEEATVRVEDGRVVAIGNVDVDIVEN